MAQEKLLSSSSNFSSNRSYFLRRLQKGSFWRKPCKKSLCLWNYSIISLIMLLGLFLRIYAGSDYFIHEWDERYHALVSKNLMSHLLTPTLYDDPVLNYDYRNWGGNHIWLHKPPVALWSMAFSMKLFGVNEIALRLPSILLSTLAIFFTFYIGEYLFSSKVGLLAAFFHSINGFIIGLASGRMATDHVDAIFLVFVELTVCLSTIYAKHKSKYLIPLIGMALGVTILTKSLPGLIIFPICLILIQGQEKWRGIIAKSLILIAICVAVVLPWHVYINCFFPKEAAFENNYNIRHLWESLEGHVGSILHHIKRMPKFFGELVWIPILWFCAFLFWSKRDYKIVAIAIWLFLPYMFFSLVKTKMHAYVMICAPAVFLIYSKFWYKIKDIKKQNRYKELRWVLLILLLLFPLKDCFKRTFFEKHDKNPGWARELRALDSKIGNKNCVVFNINRPIETMFYSSCMAYSFVPTDEEIQLLNREGYRTVVYDSVGLPEYIKDNKKILILESDVLSSV